MKRLILPLIFALLVGRLTASDGPKLTDVQKLTLQNRILSFQLAQAQLEAAVKDLQVPGYDLDLNTQTYVKKPDAK